MEFGILILTVALTMSLGTCQSQSGPTICVGKFKAIGSKCYYIEYDNNKLLWLDALHQCSQMGGHLASIQSQQELDEISKELMPDKEYHIDINSQIYERKGFLSATTGLAPRFKHKNLDDRLNRFKVCGVINNLGQMDHSLCRFNSALFVCEKSKPASQEQKQRIVQNFKKIGDKYYYIENEVERWWSFGYSQKQPGIHQYFKGT